MSTWEKVGSIREAKSGESFYIQFDTDFNATKGSRLQLQDPRQRVKKALAAGRLDENAAEEILAKIPAYISREVYLVKE